MSPSWSLYVIIGTVVTFVATLWLILWSGRQGPEPTEEDRTTGHSWDGLTERNEPLPRWWLGLFILTLVFSGGYLVVYPGLGNVAGTASWSQYAQYDSEISAAEARYAEIFAAFRDMEPAQLVQDAHALSTGKSLFSNYCSQCHGSLGYGAAGFPNLADADWLYGETFADIQRSILQGRNGIMPPMGAALGDDAAIDAMVSYVRNLSTGVDKTSATHATYTATCSACHGPNGEGNTILGAPRLNDDIWLYGSSATIVRQTIVEGRQGKMPAHEALLGADRARLIAAYVVSLSSSTSEPENGDGSYGDK
ncbi:MAG: cytochrome-c oxidase, cbb3-type subunit III [Pseudomonadota bacterium]